MSILFDRFAKIEPKYRTGDVFKITWNDGIQNLNILANIGENGATRVRFIKMRTMHLCAGKDISCSDYDIPMGKIHESLKNHIVGITYIGSISPEEINKLY